MTRVTISMPEQLAARLNREARRRGTTVSALARETISESLGAGKGERELPFARLGRSGRSDTAVNAERILAEQWRSDRDR